ncbi:MAG: hypothetical protein F6J96_19700 [Symploca sp. SIO1C2]|nr:hypothetical protein [Symploca sp. SIO1C2]
MSFHSSSFPSEWEASKTSETEMPQEQHGFHSSSFPSEWEEVVEGALPSKGFRRKIDTTPKILPHPPKN